MEKPAFHIVVTAADDLVQWGRTSKAHWQHTLGALILILCCPVLIFANNIALQEYSGSLSTVADAITSHGWSVFLHAIPQPSKSAFAAYFGWIALQIILYTYMPGMKCLGQLTPGCHRLEYTANGLAAWAVTLLLCASAIHFGIADPSVIARNWGPLLVAANTYGILLAFAAYWKGRVAPSFPDDTKTTVSKIFDFWAGVELNPRIGNNWDVKFFHNGRAGIAAWTLINISFASYQAQTLGFVTKSMVIVCILQAVYVVDFYYNEDWYTRTVDITHDHFGFMLAWGDTVFLPAFYTLPAQYLAHYPTHLTNFEAFGILALGLTGYFLFRWANFQRDYARANGKQTMIHGKPAEFIRCNYRTDNGKEHTTTLLASGWWGLVRQPNYMFDLMQTLAVCSTCGPASALPWEYFSFMCILLVHRARRNNRRCDQKYGDQWTQYCERVPYMIVPGVY